MNPRQKKIATICCIGCVILVWRIYAIVTKYMPAPVKAEAVEALPAAEANALAKLPDWIEVPAQIMKAQSALEKQSWGRDPFAPLAVQVSKAAPVEKKIVDKPTKVPSGVHFTGTSKSGDRWLAAINGSIYRVGDRPEASFTITTIESNSVTLSGDGWSFEFRLGALEPTIRRLGEGP